MSTVSRIRLLVASPSDVATERDIAISVVDELNRMGARDKGLMIEALRWEEAVRPAAGRPQQVILDQIGAYDVFLGIMWRRFGTPTGRAGSGTEEEFHQAYGQWSDTGRPYILMYFSEAPATPPRRSDDAEQLVRVARFREELDGLGLVKTYTDPARFADVLRPDLDRLLGDEFFRPALPLAPGLLAALEGERARCRQLGVPLYTPSVLLCLLQAPSGTVARIFDLVRPGFAGEVRGAMDDYVRSLPRGTDEGLPDAVRWDDREDVQRAARRAWREGAPEVEDRHLLLGILTSRGNTVRGLKEKLGDEGFSRLTGIAGRPEGVPAGTPYLGDASSG